MEQSKLTQELINEFEPYATMWYGGKTTAKQCAIICLEKQIELLDRMGVAAEAEDDDALRRWIYKNFKEPLQQQLNQLKQ